MLDAGGQQARNLAIRTKVATPRLTIGGIQNDRPVGTGFLAQSAGGTGIGVEDYQAIPVAVQSSGGTNVDTGRFITVLAGHRYKVAAGRQSWSVPHFGHMDMTLSRRQ